jgi:hypothetical protein
MAQRRLVPFRFEVSPRQLDDAQFTEHLDKFPQKNIEDSVVRKVAVCQARRAFP